MLEVLALVALLAAGCRAGGTRFDHYRVYRVLPASAGQLEALRAVEGSPGELSFWTGVSHANSSVDVMVPPHRDSEFLDLMRELQLEHSVFIKNLQELIDSEQPESDARASQFSWDRYHRLEQIHLWLRSLAADRPDVVTLENVGKSYEGRDILGVKISFRSGNPGVFLEGGIHAREWISPAVVTYIADQLLNSEDAQVREVAQSFDWHVFPSTNPDGYEYTHTTNRMWRKTRSRGRLLCHGADPNRNWGFHWRDGGASGNPCLDTFAGTEAFSEPETRQLASYISSVSSQLKVYLSVHSYSQLLLTPFGVSGVRPANHQALLDIGNKTAESLARRHGTRYTVGNIVDVLYVASGSSVDWAVGELGVPVALVYELRDTGRYGFLLPADQITASGEETLDSLLTLVAEARRLF
ncbi:zinc carboxypeptidase-like isoform X2 [Bacillus rossius redtenbacheri]|uniref:zinc carboxypeptidase-like isoform X2 n=1 Tax=Bacillus rossius redtenbacheri TaxID=93214 RepID=UPI002FDC911F